MEQLNSGANPKKTLAIGSHTDSVYNGGQYDGPARCNSRSSDSRKSY